MSDEKSVKHYEVTAKIEDHGKRLDRYLSDVFSDISRSQIKALILSGKLTKNSKIIGTPNAKVIENAHYHLCIPAPVELILTPQNIPLDVLYEDQDIIVVNKSAGMPVHPGAGHWKGGTLVHALLYHCATSLSGIGGVERPGIVHRLDKDTSGVLVVAKHDQAHLGLSKQFSDHSVKRNYIAFSRNAPDPENGELITHLVRSGTNRQKMAVLTITDKQEQIKGKKATTFYQTLQTYGQKSKSSIGRAKAAKLVCQLKTGRTHQIRVHMAHLGCPLLGDQLYGRKVNVERILNQTNFKDNTASFSNSPITDQSISIQSIHDSEEKIIKPFRRQALHAAILGFVHPINHQYLEFETKLPKDMQRLEKFLQRL